VTLEEGAEHEAAATTCGPAVAHEEDEADEAASMRQRNRQRCSKTRPAGVQHHAEHLAEHRMRAAGRTLGAAFAGEDSTRRELLSPL
jgi:hypothetical protein